MCLLSLSLSFLFWYNFWFTRILSIIEQRVPVYLLLRYRSVSYFLSSFILLLCHLSVLCLYLHYTYYLFHNCLKYCRHDTLLLLYSVCFLKNKNVLLHSHILMIKIRKLTFIESPIAQQYSQQQKSILDHVVHLVILSLKLTLFNLKLFSVLVSWFWHICRVQIIYRMSLKISLILLHD